MHGLEALATQGFHCTSGSLEPLSFVSGAVTGVTNEVPVAPVVLGLPPAGTISSATTVVPIVSPPIPTSADIYATMRKLRRRYRHTCDVCNKRFTRKEHLDHHKVTHSGEKPFKCDVCLKAFSLKSNLQTHKLIHTQPRRFACSWPGCKKTFNQKMHLKRHCDCIHLKLKPHACPLCDKRFGQKSSMTRHIQIIHSSVLGA